MEKNSCPSCMQSANDAITWNEFLSSFGQISSLKYLLNQRASSMVQQKRILKLLGLNLPHTKQARDNEYSCRCLIQKGT